MTKRYRNLYFLFSSNFRNADATQVFHAFHEGSKSAYKQLELLKKRNYIDITDGLKTING